MLKISVPLSSEELFDEEKEEFVEPEGFTLELEHSLVTLSKWESFFRKPFLSRDEKTTEETLWYIEAMILTENPPAGILQKLTQANLEAINNYIVDDMTATTFHNVDKTPSKEIITAELIYYWMVALNIPLDCQYWHLNRLFTFIKVANLKSAPEKKMSRADAVRQRKELNEKRRREMNTHG